MSTKREFVEWIVDTVNDKKVTTRAMFGEFALYYDKKVVALICDNTFFLKITKNTTKILETNPHTKAKGIKTGPAYPGSKDFYILPEEILENRESLKELLKECAKDVIIKK